MPCSPLPGVRPLAWGAHKSHPPHWPHPPHSHKGHHLHLLCHCVNNTHRLYSKSHRNLFTTHRITRWLLYTHIMHTTHMYTNCVQAEDSDTDVMHVHAVCRHSDKDELTLSGQKDRCRFLHLEHYPQQEMACKTGEVNDCWTITAYKSLTRKCISLTWIHTNQSRLIWRHTQVLYVPSLHRLSCQSVLD